MSRSYHSNRSARYILQRDGLDAVDIERIWIKRDVKRRVREQRVSGRDPEARSPVSGIRIVATDNLPGLHFPTSESEIREILARVEAPYLEGVRSITLALGMGHQERGLAELNAESVAHVTRDPIFQRPGDLVGDGLYFPLVLGTYEKHTAAVELYGYVVTPECELTPFLQFALKHHFVNTLLHEMAHHHQYRTAMLQGARTVSQLDERLEARAEEVRRMWLNGPVRSVLRSWGEALREKESSE